ncbi:flavin reductase family protein [Streptomyces sp. JNUCC 64]
MIPVSAAADPTSPCPPRHDQGSPAPLREVMSRFATGVVVLTVGGEPPHAMTANAFSSVSLSPPSVLCSVAHSAVMHQALTTVRRFGVSVLSAGQEPLARHFADKKRELGAAQFARGDWFAGERTGAPLLTGALAWLECELDAAHVSFDHTIFVGTVLASRRGDDGRGLLFFDGRFGTAGGDV